jgi:Acetyltransferase (GNAT) domain
MEACRGELSFEPRDLELTPIAIAEHDGKPIGVAQLRIVDGEADLLKLFVEPSALRSGTGKALLAWAIGAAKKRGATRLTIESDPDAAPFYRRMGAYDVGQAPSGSVPGRMLPKLAMNLFPANWPSGPAALGHRGRTDHGARGWGTISGTEGSDDPLKTGHVICGNEYVHAELVKILKLLG